MQKREEGFEGLEEEEKAAKNKRDESINDYYMIPEAKPLLHKNYIDMKKPKILIKEVLFRREPFELLNAQYDQNPIYSSVGEVGKHKLFGNSETNIWSKYVLTQAYTCCYLKYYKGNINQLTGKGFKKFKMQLQKLSQYNQNVFSTFILDLSFLSDVGSYLLKNLQDSKIEDQINEQCEDEVTFDSRFECGNLFSVFKKVQQQKIQFEYDLILQTDINTKGYSNWFYFSVKSKKKKIFKFNIVNMQKIHSLFLSGMKVAIYSYRKSLNENVDWYRGGYNYLYGRNQLMKSKQTVLNVNNNRLNTLSFSYDQQYEDDIIYIAMNYPYSYSKLLKFMDGIEKVAKLNQHIYLKRQTLCKTISSNICPVLTLTWKRDKKNDESKSRKKIIGVIARQHPCETVSSFVMEGFINNLVYLNNQYSVDLLKKYIFKIVPMMNIDGVIYGNSRCDIAGADINRRWTKSPNTFLYPTVAATRSMFNRLSMEGYQIDYFIDLHGHSKKMGSFIYGCRGFDELETKQFSWIMSRLNKQFSFEDCSFGLSQNKRETARGSMSGFVGHKKSLTVESSFFGYRTSDGKKHFEVRDLEKIGQSLLEAIYTQQTRDSKVIQWGTLRSDMKKWIEQMSKRDQDEDVVSSGSDSNPSVDELNEKQKAQTFLPPQIASKIGLVEIKIAQKIHKSKQLQRKSSIDIRKALDELDQAEAQQHHLQLLDSKASEILPHTLFSKDKSVSLRETKSVTKITPFKFTERSRKSQSDFKDRIRIAIEIAHIKPEQKLSIPSLPQVHSDGRSFWKKMNKQYETLIKQKQSKTPKLNLGKQHF